MKVLISLFLGVLVFGLLAGTRSQATNLVGSTWVGHSERRLEADTLFIKTDSTVEHYSEEVSFVYRGDYTVSKDTLIIRYKTQALEVNDVSNLEHNQVYKYLIRTDSLYLVELSSKRNGVWVDRTDYLKAYHNLNLGRLQ